MSQEENHVASDSAASSKGESAKKGRPTPKRKEQEARNFRPLVVTDKKAAKQRARQAREEQFQREQLGLRTGREDLLPAMHKGEDRRFVRNWLDSRYTLCEWMIVIILVLMIAPMIVVLAIGTTHPWADPIRLWTLIITYGVLIIGTLEAVVLSWIANSKAKEKFRDSRYAGRSLRWYGFSRAIITRRWRTPSPQVKRGEKIS